MMIACQFIQQRAKNVSPLFTSQLITAASANKTSNGTLRNNYFCSLSNSTLKEKHNFNASVDLVSRRLKSSSSLHKRAAQALSKNKPQNLQKFKEEKQSKNLENNKNENKTEIEATKTESKENTIDNMKHIPDAAKIETPKLSLSNDSLEPNASTPTLTSPPEFHEFAPRMCVVGVGGAGGNAVNNMIASSLPGVDFLAINTDAQHLSKTLTDNRLQIGVGITGGLGCGANPDAGRLAAEESRDIIAERIQDAHMVFITAGMGGGTGTGAAPVVAEICYDLGILTVGIVTSPFRFEGTHRKRLAKEGINHLEQVVDTIIVVPNQNLFGLIDEKTSLIDSFALADDVLLAGVKSVTDLMTRPGLINLDFADVQSVMHGMGNAMLGSGQATGDDRAMVAAEQALKNPILGDINIGTAKGMLVNITGGSDLTLFEVDKASQLITDIVDNRYPNIIFGTAYDSSLEGNIRISVVAAGIDNDDP